MKYTGSDPYIDENGVLINKKGIKDEFELDRVERASSYMKALDLDRNPIKGKFDLKHLQDIHKHLFGDIYPFAGKIRDGYLQKGQQDFTMGYRIIPQAEKLFTQLKNEQFLKKTEPAKIAGRLAYYMGEINAIHPFREGNGRAQRIFISQLAKEAGFELTFSKSTQEEMINASIQAHRCDYKGLESIIEKGLTPLSLNSEKEYKIDFSFNKEESEKLGQKSYDVLVNGVRADNLLKKDSQLSKALEGLATHKDIQQKGITAEALKSGIIQPLMLNNEFKVNRPEARTINAIGSKIEPKMQELQAQKTKGFSL
ncbi:cell filamentation protein Fic [Haemophilus influenzae biotype aegyptius]|uniref:protein adenylyltransferase n=1 Tax=Haemophilus influenzae biotype aegyptius TaxID=725 RepID=Q8VRE7_HAEIF|nr:Fic family protein [Haemophilus influenzae]AAL47098.1 unknown [Haemophilus influenzae biotype aegyptius]AAM64115.1 cell filamentation-like protein [Haemophilus influenzae biotype aegyptius]TMQ39383.1 cell filamentation protein Fic [Haemophilus influenzae biotype aegyptius]TMQ40954.1 cell filamentation protein Fic [Haemophilus influenzae biotype aegyptius]TMQ41435.1 cell filamentation protein Fic [Haemophilus influenzae biotype aegyptius]